MFCYAMDISMSNSAALNYLEALAQSNAIQLAQIVINLLCSIIVLVKMFDLHSCFRVVRDRRQKYRDGKAQASALREQQMLQAMIAKLKAFEQATESKLADINDQDLTLDIDPAPTIVRKSRVTAPSQPGAVV